MGAWGVGMRANDTALDSIYLADGEKLLKFTPPEN